MNRNQVKYLASSGIAAGILASPSAHAQLVVQNTDETTGFDTGTTYFNGDANPVDFSGTENGQEFSVSAGKNVVGFEPSTFTGLTTGSEVTGPLALSSSVDGTDTFSSLTNLSDGPQYYGFELSENDGTHYGYIEATEDESGGGLPVDFFFDTIYSVAFDETAGEAVTIPDFYPIPEPSTGSLLAAAAAGAGGLALYRRSRRNSTVGA